MKTTYKNAPENSAKKWSWRFACQILAYTPPIPKGGLSVKQRDIVAIKLGRITAKKIKAGLNTCVWHELAEYYQQPCFCAVCRPDIKRFC